MLKLLKSNYVQMCAFCLFVHNAVGQNVYQFFISIMLSLYLNGWDKVVLCECEIG